MIKYALYTRDSPEIFLIVSLSIRKLSDFSMMILSKSLYFPLTDQRLCPCLDIGMILDSSLNSMTCGQI